MDRPIDTRLIYDTHGRPDLPAFWYDLDIGVDGTVLAMGDINWRLARDRRQDLRPAGGVRVARISVLKFYNWTKKTATIVNIIVNEQVFPIGMEFQGQQLNLGWTDAIVGISCRSTEAAVGVDLLGMLEVRSEWRPAPESDGTLSTDAGALALA